MTTRFVTTAIAAVTATWALSASGPAVAFEPGPALHLPSPTLARSGHIPVDYQFGRRISGHARLHVLWTDSLGRIVEDHHQRLDLHDADHVTFDIDMARAVAMKNHLHVDLSLDAADKNNRHPDRPALPQQSADVDFGARPPYTGWRDYVVFMWQRYPAHLLPALKRLGVTAGQYSGRRTAAPDFLIDHNMRWYTESVAPDFYAPYHRYHRHHPKNWAFTQAKARYDAHPDSLAAFKRHPSLSDPRWQKRIHDRALATARRNAPYRPYFYSLSDEPGIAELGAQWDFDFSHESLTGMRQWLRGQYASLAALNREWGSHFPDWAQVVPPTTNQAMARPGNNFAAWADFKTWMDISFADALKMGADAVREGDPKAYVAIGGAQKPGWGGYDYTRLTRALTAIEPYDIGRSVDVVHSLAPDMPILSTSFSGGSSEEQRVWHELLHGNRGLIIWDAGRHFVHPDGTPGRRGRRASGYYHEIERGIGALIINSRPVNQSIAIHYSQPSLRTQWMLERRPDGAKWMQRSARYERTHNHFMRLRESWCDLIEDEGLQFKFLAYDRLGTGALRNGDYKVLILPESSALSAAAARAIRAFIAAGGTVIADGIPGTYDEHSRQRVRSPLADLFGEPAAGKINVRAYGKGKAIVLNLAMAGYLQERLKGTQAPLQRRMARLLRKAGVRPKFAVEDGAGHPIVGIERRMFANGRVRLISLQSNPQLRVDELGPPDFRSNRRFKHPTTVHLHLPRAMYVYDTRAHKALGRHQELTLTVGPFKPTILAVSNRPLPEMAVAIPSHAARGSKITLRIHTRNTPANVQVFHIDVRNPQGQRIRYYSGNIIADADAGDGMRTIPLAVDDASGRWTVTVQDLLSGQTVTRGIDVE